MALDEEEDLLIGPPPPDVSAEDELASADDRSREVLRITSCAPAHRCSVHAMILVMRSMQSCQKKLLCGYNVCLAKDQARLPGTHHGSYHGWVKRYQHR